MLGSARTIFSENFSKALISGEKEILKIGPSVGELKACRGDEAGGQDTAYVK